MVSSQHPRFRSLTLRNKLVDGYEKGITSAQGLIAHGRGEAFDYLLGEQTSANALNAVQVACAYLLTARYPILSVNGNTAALASDKIAEFCTVTNIPVEVNLFHRSTARIERIADHLRAYGVRNVFTGSDPVELKGIASDRAKVDKRGIYKSDVIFVPLEDGDRAQALTQLGKIVLTVDLNPLSRTATTSNVTIVDEVTRAMSNLVGFAKHFKNKGHQDDLNAIKASFNNVENLTASYAIIRNRLESLMRSAPFSHD